MSSHVVVIGAGIVGLCAADSLLARGFRVTILDRDSPGAGCSYGNGGMIVPSHFVPLAAPGMVGLGLRMMLSRQSPFGIERIIDLQTLGWMTRFARTATKSHVERCGPLLTDLHLASRDLYEQIISEMGIDVGYHRRGLLMLSKTHKAHEAEVRLAGEAKRLGLTTAVLSRADLSKLEPDLAMDVAGAVHFLDDAHFTPRPFMSAFESRVADKGAETKHATEVTGFWSDGQKIRAVQTNEGEVEADEFVLAAGSWSGGLAAKLGLKMPMLAGKGYGLTVNDPPQQPRIPAILTEARVAMTPMLDGVRFVGVLELSKPQANPNPSRIEGMRRNIPAYYPSFTAQALDRPVWCGLRPCSPDGLPYIGRSGRAANLVVASGHAMMGMSLGPITGKLVADIIAGDPPSYCLDLMSPDRYV